MDNMKYLACFFAIACFVLCFMYNLAQNKIEVLESEKKALYASKCYLENEIERRNEIEIQTSERLQELSQLAEEEKNKGGFDWGSPLPANDSVVIRLRKN